MLFYYKHQDLFHVFHLGNGILEEARFIYILMANIRVEIQEQISPHTVFAAIKCQSTESLQRSQEFTCEMQFLLVTESLHTRCLSSVAPVIGKEKEK